MENSKLKGLFGTPCNASKGGCISAGTEASKRTAVNSNIKGAKYLGGDTGGYGTAGVDTKGMGGGHGGRTSGLSH